VRDGRILRTAAINVGGRLVATDEAKRLTRIEVAAHTVADTLGIPLALGEVLSDEHRRAIAQALAGCLMELIENKPRSPLTRELLLTEDLGMDAPVDAIVFSGGVSEYIYQREERDFLDLAMPLAEAVRAGMASAALPAPVQPATERIRATVIGASQFTVQLSGNTLSISDPDQLPFRNIPVLLSRLDSERMVEAREVTEHIQRAFALQDLTEGEGQAALAFEWDGLPAYAHLRQIAEGIVSALPQTIAGGQPVILVFTGDFANLIGNIITKDMGITNPVISIDNLELQEFDYIDIGEMIYPARVVPVVVKSLVFPEVKGPTAEVAAR
jgi:ethanolamine utilization protein EutA